MILIVDDSPEDIDMLSGALSGFGQMIALNAEKALKLARVDPPPDLILLDIMMPGMDGYEVCAELKSDERTKDIPVIFLTAKTEPMDIIRGFQMGGQDYITKPFHTEELHARVNTHLELKKNRERLKEANTMLEERVKQRTAELAEAYRELEEFDSAKNEFLKLLNHEIRTPLNGILGSLSILKKYKLPSEVEEFIRILDLSVKRLEQFSYKALDITALRTKGKDALRKETCDVPAMLDKIKAELSDQMEAKQLSIVTKGCPSTASIFVDKARYMNTLKYVILNAIYVSDTGMSIEITCKEHDDRFELCIKDNGPGFSKEAIKNLYKPFGSVGDHVDSKIGLSLYYAKLVLDAHEGSIRITGNKPTGSAVRISIPVH